MISGQLSFDAWSEVERDWRPTPPAAAITTSAFGRQCVTCGRPFIPDVAGQDRCHPHHLEHEAEEAQRARQMRRPDPRS